MSHKIPPWSVPIGLACCAVALSSMTAWPGCMAVSVKPISLATGGGESVPRYSSKVQGEAKPEATVGWSNDPEVHGPDCQDIRVHAEESEPEMWETGAEESNAARDRGCESRAHPGHAPCTG